MVFGKRGMEGLPQKLGALDVADEYSGLAQAGFKAAKLIQTAQPPPSGVQSSYRKSKEQDIQALQVQIQAQAAQMAADGVHPREIGAYVAARTEWTGSVE
jgi:hypothetical protein